MRLPDPIANTTTEAYLAYKAGVLAEGDLKPKLYDPYIHLDAWLAYWTGLVNTYPLDKNNDPEMLTDEEAYIAYLSGVTNTYPQEFRDPADIRVAAYLRYLISARFGRPEYPVTNEELYLSMLKTKYIPSGDPSSDIEIDGTAKAPFVDVKMYGDTYQQTYTGKNLFAPPVGGSASGVTFTLNADGTYDISGTATARAQIVLFLDTPWLENGEIYTIKANQPLGDVMARVEAYSNTSYLRTNYVLDSTSQQQTGAWNGENATKCCFVLRVESGKTVNISGLGIQLELGSTATSYEPYVGGASPNPDYPQTVQTVTGRQMVKVEGKNLWGGFASDFSKTSSGVTFVNKADGTITANGTANGTALSLFSVDAITQNRLITLSAGDYTISGATEAVRLEVIDTSGAVVADTSGSISGVKAFSISEPMQVAVRAKMGNTAVADNVTIKPMLEKGSTATAYEPYSSNDYEINLGKNLFNKNDVVNGIPSATDGDIISTTSIGRTSGYIPVMANTTYSHTGHPLGWAVVAWYKADKSFIKRVGDVTVLTSPSEAAYARVSCAEANLGTCQFEAGEPTTYAPYFTPIELCKLGAYQDYIWKDGESWKVHKATGKGRLISTDIWYASGTHTIKCLYANLSLDNIKTSVYNEISNYFTRTSAENLYQGVIAVGFAFGQDGVYLSNNDWSRDTATAFLSTNNVYVNYTLSTPTDTTITDQTLIAQLEALVNGGAENGTTYIKVNATDPNLPGLLYVEAPKYE